MKNKEVNEKVKRQLHNAAYLLAMLVMLFGSVPVYAAETSGDETEVESVVDDESTSAENADTLPEDEDTPSDTIMISKSEYDAMALEISELKNTIELLKSAENEVKASGSSDATINALQSKIESLQNELSNLTNAYNSISATNSSLRNKVSELTSQNSNLSSKLKTANETAAKTAQTQTQIGTNSTNVVPTTNINLRTSSDDNTVPNKAAVVGNIEDTEEITVNMKNANSSNDVTFENISFDFGSEDEVTTDVYSDDPMINSILTVTSGDGMETGGFGGSSEEISFTDEEMGITQKTPETFTEHLYKEYHLTKMKLLFIAEIIVALIATAVLLCIARKIKKSEILETEEMTEF